MVIGVDECWYASLMIESIGSLIASSISHHPRHRPHLRHPHPHHPRPHPRHTSMTYFRTWSILSLRLVRIYRSNLFASSRHETRRLDPVLKFVNQHLSMLHSYHHNPSSVESTSPYRWERSRSNIGTVVCDDQTE